MRLTPALLPLLILVLAVPVSADLDVVERQLVDAVTAANEDALVLLEQAVDINSGTMNFAGVRGVGKLFADELEPLGFDVSFVDGTDFDRADHLVAERAGDGPHILLIGHLDTVFEVDSPFQGFERLGEDQAAGPGVTDMKGGNVILVFALKALDAIGALDGTHLTVVLTGDEEKSGRPLSLARDVLTRIEADYALGFEDGDSDPSTAVIARRGSASWELRVLGTPAHSSQIFTEPVGAGAIYEATRILHAFYDELSSEADLTFNPGVVLGGTQVDFDAAQGRGQAFGKTNVVAEHAVVAGDLRALSPEQYDRAKSAMRTIVANHLPGTSAELTFSDGYPPMAATKGNRELLGIYDEVSRDLGFGGVAAVDPRQAGAADVSFVAGKVPRVLDGLGLMGRGGHTVDEVADLTTLPMNTQRAAVLIYRLTTIENGD